MGCFRSMESSLMVGSVFLVSVGRHRGLKWRLLIMVWWMCTQYLPGFSNFPTATRDISVNACQQTCEVSRTWPRRQINRGAPSESRKKWKCTPWHTTSRNGGASVSSRWRSLSYDEVANQALYGLFGYNPHVCRNGQWWMYRNATWIPGFTKSLIILKYTQSGQDRPKSYSSIQCSKSLEVQVIEWAVAGICTSCPAGAKQSTTHMVTGYGSWWLW